jgi:tetratricopeptide (TPR) repeat protein
MRALGLLVVLAGAFCLASFQVCDGDVFWQLAQGQVMLDTGAMVRTNLFSHTYPDFRWVNPEWLFQVSLAAAHRLGGWAAVSALKVALVLLLAGTLYAVLLGRRDRPLPAASLAIAAIAVMRFRLTERPQLVSLLLFTVTVLIVDRHRREAGRLVWLLPPLFALWANFHAEVLLGLLLLFGIAAGEALDRLRETPPARARPSTLGAVACLCALATGLNPQGYRVLLVPFAHFSLDETIQVTEFMHSTPALVPLFWLALAAAVAVAVAVAARSRTRADWADLVPVAGVALLGVRYIREAPYLAILAAPLVQRALAPPPPADGRTARWREPAVAALAFGMFVWAARFDALMPYRWGWGLDERSFPVAAADLLLREPLPPTLYNDYGAGGYLLFRLRPRIGVFQDSRSGAYPDDFVARLHARAAGLDWAALLNRYGVNTALVSVQDVTRLFSPDAWGLVFWDDRYAVLVRRTDAHRALLQRLEYRRFLPVPAPPIGDDRGALEELAGEMRRNQAERREPSGTLASDIGLVLARLGRHAEAREAFLRAVALSPRDAPGWAYLGRAEAALGRAEEARRAFDRALEIDPALDQVRAWRAEAAAAAPAPGRGGR